MSVQNKIFEWVQRSSDYWKRDPFIRAAASSEPVAGDAKELIGEDIGG